MIKKLFQNNRLKLPLLATAALVAMGLGTYFYIRHNRTSPSPQTAQGINLAPATKEEKQESDKAKSQAPDKTATNTAPPSQSPAAKKQVSVIITHAGTDSVNAYVTGVFEEGGVCKALFTQGTTSVTRTSEGFGNVSYTQCAPITPSLPNTSSWSVTVTYNSNAAEGKSQPQTF